MKNVPRRSKGFRAIRFAGAFALAALIVLPGQYVSAQTSGGISTADKAAIEKIVRDYILENPEIITEAVQILKNRKEMADSEADRQMLVANRDALLNDPEAPVGGNPKGDVTVVEFFDYRCGVCKRIHPIVDQLVKTDPNIRRVYKEWPILGPNSVLASRAAIASRSQGKYLAFHKVLMEATSTYSEAAIMEMAGSVGLDTARLARDMRSPETDAILRNNYILAENLQLNGTPSFVIGNTLLRGGRDLESLRAIVAEARAKKK
jgi:protein-disulfide isomerase